MLLGSLQKRATAESSSHHPPKHANRVFVTHVQRVQLSHTKIDELRWRRRAQRAAAVPSLGAGPGKRPRGPARGRGLALAAAGASSLAQFRGRVRRIYFVTGKDWWRHSSKLQSNTAQPSAFVVSATCMWSITLATCFPSTNATKIFP